MNARCWKHPRRRAIACGALSHKGYCRACWPAECAMPVHNFFPHVLFVACWPKMPEDATIACAV